MSPNLGFYNVEQVLAFLTVSKPTLMRMVKRGEFPQSVEISPRRLAWPRDAVDKWIKEKSK